MSDHTECPECGADLKGQRCRECGWPNLLNEPELEYVEGSEIAGTLDVSNTGADKICRPLIFNHEDGALMCLTIEDARRLLDFLTEALPYLEQQAGMMRQ